ncbi:GNAT family N-acetyltransferase ['Paenibacillus yunnanensis' Narsing Rao et al. 2020]|uniref:GNAT family N-acetyltransferase n=1 Tax=Paenibacillus tengchongensis TaxID=2608684 RepID=UPI00124C6AC4|nr:GNAT family N-acetyltransferase [Paenibacillus tengchongensis]
MDIVIKQLRKADFGKARNFAVEGMHLHWYASSKMELYFYSKYFWYLEISKATQALGAYMGDQLVGVLLADMKNEPTIFTSFWYKLYVKSVGFLINLGYSKASNNYESANSKMLEHFRNKHTPDGEINFFAVDPAIKGKGIGTLLLQKLEREEQGKLIYLYTDSGSTYQFYLHRGFEMFEQHEIELQINRNIVELQCFLFSKRL